MEKTNAKSLVASSYNDMASAYNGWAASEQSPRDTYTSKILSRVPHSARILELGCGGGLPITQLLLQHINSPEKESQSELQSGVVVANDISEQQIALAKENAPGAEYVCGDMTKLSFPNDDFDAVVAFFSIFHLPRDEQPAMVQLVADWLKPGGWFVGCLSTLDAAELHGDFFGKKMFWSSFDIQGNQKMLRDAKLDIIEEEVLDATDDSDTNNPDYGLKFWWFLAKKQ